MTQSATYNIEGKDNTINTLSALNESLSMEISVNLVHTEDSPSITFKYKSDGDCLVKDKLDYIDFHVDDIDNLICALNRIKDIHKEI